MAGRDAFLLFLGTLPYPNIEEATQGDSPAKLMLLRVMSKGVSGEAILACTSYLRKMNVVPALLASMTPDERIKHIIRQRA